MATKKTPTKKTVSKYAQAGDDARRAAQRKLLLTTLKGCDWNLARAADELGLSGSPGVIRALKDVAPDEYDAARSDGRVRAGARAGE